MSDWRDPILAHFTAEIAAIARLTVVSDPDRLLAEPRILEKIAALGFEVIPFDDHVAFRYAYESRFRQLWDRGETTRVVVVLRTEGTRVNELPFDLLERARRDSRLLAFSLAELFPHLAPHVLVELDRGRLDALFQAQGAHQPGPLGENATKDFVLRHVFEIAPELVKTDVDLLRVLLRRHYGGHVLPASLDERLVRLLRETGRWGAWPLDRIVPSRLAFFEFLEERWPSFLRRQLELREVAISEAPAEYAEKYPGPLQLPFDHPDIRVYVDNLFIEGFLTPTSSVPMATVEGTWMAVGVAGERGGDRVGRLARLLELLEKEWPAQDAEHGRWLQTAQRWAELAALRWTLSPGLLGALADALERVHSRLEESFGAWLWEHYATLHSLPYLPQPVMVHQIPRFLAHGLQPANGQRRALLVIDGLALDQWVVVRDSLRADAALSLSDGAAFAWIPTLTSVSRQSVFAGAAPLFFAPSIEYTSKEESHWRRFWEDAGFRSRDIAYLCQKAQEDDDTFSVRVAEAAEHPRCRVLGAVIGTVDEMLHGAVTGSDGLHASVRHWVDRGALKRLVESLISGGFEVFVTADHGNVEATGIGKPDVGAVADSRGERVHVFRDPALRETIARDYPGTLAWPQTGLPEDYRALIAPPRRAFIAKGKHTVAHGGVCLEEVVVPFAAVSRKP